jgi:lytic cellulose monooxygenase (C1-hydroxylating)
MYARGGKFSFKFPSCIRSGQYHLRAEVVALHGAGSYPGVQLYMECAQLNKKPPTVSFAGEYKGSDPGIKINVSVSARSFIARGDADFEWMYNPPPATYIVPGPPVFQC